MNGVRGGERLFRTSLPLQGWILAHQSPTYTLWSADLIARRRRRETLQVDRREVIVYANNTASLNAGATVELVVVRAQRAVDTLGPVLTTAQLVTLCAIGIL